MQHAISVDTMQRGSSGLWKWFFPQALTDIKSDENNLSIYLLVKRGCGEFMKLAGPKIFPY